jgi:hypothetical protein
MIISTSEYSVAVLQDGLLIVEAVFGRLEAMPPVGAAAAAGRSTGADRAAPPPPAASGADADDASADAEEPQPSPQPSAHRLDSGV